MQVSVRHRPSYAVAYLILGKGEAVFCEPGSMMVMSGGMSVAARTSGGLVASTLRSTFAQEGFFMARYRAEREGAWVAVAPRLPGDIATMEVDPTRGVILDQGAFLAHSEGVELSTRLANAQTFALRKGAAVIRASGTGTLVIGSFGALERVDLGPGESLIVDTGHMAAWSESMELRIGPLRGVVSSALTKEGLVGQFKGPGFVYIQTRAEQGPRGWLRPRLGQNP